MDDFLRDLRLSARRLRRRPAGTLVAVATIGLAIGAVTAIFSAVHGVLLRPLPVTGEDSLVKLWKYDPEHGFDHFPIVFEEFRRWRDHVDLPGRSRSFEALAAMVSEGAWRLPMAAATPEGEPALVTVAPVSADFFAVAGVSPVLGRGFERGDEAAGEVRATVVSHAAWRERFGADPGVLGRTLSVNGRPHQVVGVMPPGFDFPAGAELWTCLPETAPTELEALGRLREGATLGEARAEIATVARQFARDEAPFLEDKVVVATPLRESLVGEVRRPLLVLLGAVGFLLAIAVANVANLLLVETAARRPQLAIRSALGASRGRLARELLLESGLLAVLGGLLGVALAVPSLDLLRFLQPSSLPRLDAIGLHPAVLACSVLVTAASALAFGLAPALRAARAAPAWALRRGGGAASRRRPSLLRLLVVSETALALVLLIGAGLLARSFVEHLRLDRGFRTKNVLSVALKVPSSERGPDRMRSVYADLLPRIRGLPGVLAVSPTINRPFATTDGFDALPTIEGTAPEATADLPWVNLDVVDGGYVETLGLRIEEGRFFDPRDQASSLPVAVVSRSFAERIWPGERAVGRRLKIRPEEDWKTVVGVVSNLRLRDPAEVRLDLYLPLAQSPWAPYYLAVRTAQDPESTGALLRREVRRLLPGTVVEIEALESLLGKELAAPRFNAQLVTAFAFLALVLAAIGIYGVMASLTGERRQEIGIRMALGATAGQVERLVLGDGLRLALAGIALGVAGALALTRLMTSLLFRTSPFDPATFAVLAAVLLAVAWAAASIPARRAARLDPVSVIRTE